MSNTIKARRTITPKEAADHFGTIPFPAETTAVVVLTLAEASAEGNEGYYEERANGSFYCCVYNDDIVTRDRNEAEKFLVSHL